MNYRSNGVRISHFPRENHEGAVMAVGREAMTAFVQEQE